MIESCDISAFGLSTAVDSTGPASKDLFLNADLSGFFIKIILFILLFILFILNFKRLS